MNLSEKSVWMNGKNLLVLLLGIVTMYLIVTSLVDSRFQEIESNTRAEIAEQQVLLAAIAEITARSGADAVTELIVRDCTMEERIDFDDLLGRLNDDLNHAQLVELERLFGRCASFYSERKSVMTARLSREIEIYENYVHQLMVITDDDSAEEYMVEGWQSLAAQERKQSELFSRLVSLQDKIITTLLAGKAADSPEIIAILHEVKEVQETLIVANKQASTVRSSLIPL